MYLINAGQGNLSQPAVDGEGRIVCFYMFPSRACDGLSLPLSLTGGQVGLVLWDIYLFIFPFLLILTLCIIL